MKEALGNFRYYGFPLHTAMPRIFVAIMAKLSMMLDLTDRDNLKRIQIDEYRLIECDWRKDMTEGKEALSQLVGHAAKESDFEAIVKRSAEDKNGRNIVVFTDNLRKSSILSVLNPDRLAPYKLK